MQANTTLESALAAAMTPALGGAGGCLAAAPELLQGGTSAFLASLLRTYPRGPTSPEALAAWAAAATAFLQQHRELQRQQRQAAAEAADRASAFTAGNPRSVKAHKPKDNGDADSGDADGGNGDFDGGDRIEGSPANSTAAVQYGGLPLVRRVMLAQLMLGWISSLHHQLSGDPHTGMALEMSRVVALLYDIHVESVAQRALIEYFHISKSGGTSWANAASANACRNARATTARIIEFDDECRWNNGTLLRAMGVQVVTTPGARQVCSRFGLPARLSPFIDCEARRRHVLFLGHQYFANEYTPIGGLHDMYGTHICPQFVNIINVREPLARLTSNIQYMILRLRTLLFSKPPASELFSKVFCNATAAFWEEFSPPVVDNYNIRTLVGEGAYHTPLYGIGEAHEALAKQLLVQYDLVLDLNAGDAAADLLMRQGLGWNKTLAEVRVWTAEQVARHAGLDLETDCPLGNLKPLFERQKYDQRWYSFGRSLSRLDQLFLSAAAHMGLRLWPAEWAAEQQQQQREGPRGGGPSGSSAGWSAARGGAAASSCGLLGAAEALRGK
ncbi:hypothetical protein PLESTM_000772600 [Pleodorina starrii]|nr:hypothetical protein PLESTM_000772600 [Pleodorina starrii]